MAAISGQLDEAGTTVTPSLERYDGALRLRVAEGRIDGFRQTPPMRLFRPHPEPGEPRSVVVGNVAGGVVGGDRLGVQVEVAENEDLLATTQAAEKIYRSDGATATMTVDLSVADGGTLEWLSAGTILFDGARLDRTTILDVAAGGRLLYCETLVLGRLARGEVFASGALRDRIRLRRGGRLAWAESWSRRPGRACGRKPSAGRRECPRSGQSDALLCSARNARRRGRGTPRLRPGSVCRERVRRAP